MPAANWGILGGGAKYFFWGAEMSTNEGGSIVQNHTRHRVWSPKEVKRNAL